MECLVLGGESVGKTLLVKRMKEPNTNLESTIPTVGVEITDLNLTLNNEEDIYLSRGKEIKQINCSISLKEVGSSISSRWNLYYSQCDCIIFIIDISDCGSLPSSLVLLHEILAYTEVVGMLKNKPISILLNKCDLCDPISLIMAKNFLQLKDLHYYEKLNLINIFQGSCFDNSLPNQAIQWLKLIYSHSKIMIS
eukprot:gene6702-9193_t